jgi:flagellar basal body rod protein FlgC
MPLNIITHGMKAKKVSNEEVAETLARANEEAAIREKHGYKERSRQLRKTAEKWNFGKGVRAKAVIDAQTYFRHEQQSPGCMSDPGYTKEFLRDNPETRL